MDQAFPLCSISPQLLADFYYRPLLHRLSTTYVIVMFGTLRKVYEVHRCAVEVRCHAAEVHRHAVEVHRHAVEVRRRAVEVRRRAAKVHRHAAESLTRCRCSTALQVLCKLILVRSLYALSASDV